MRVNVSFTLEVSTASWILNYGDEESPAVLAAAITESVKADALAAALEHFKRCGVTVTTAAAA